MSVSIELTAAQARAIAELAETESRVSLRQLADGGGGGEDVYVTTADSDRRWRVDAGGRHVDAGDHLPVE